jgi:hypothetical protein
VAYTIQIPNGNNIPLTDQEIDDLEAAMDILAPAVADEVFNSNQRLRGRRLGVTVQLPTSVVGTNETGMLSERVAAAVRISFVYACDSHFRI